VKTLMGSTISLDVEEAETVWRVKEMIFENLNKNNIHCNKKDKKVGIEQIKLAVEGKCLSNENFLRDYNIKSDSILYMFLNIKG
jgi:uncharacterized ubiquitin-like protein YukD